MISKEQANATRARRDGLILLLLGSVVFVLLGAALENSAATPASDFRALYYPARTLVHNSDPYSIPEVSSIYQEDSANFPRDDWKARVIATCNVYPPSAFTFMFPFAMLQWGPAHILWLILTVVSILFASFLMWNLGASYAPLVSGGLIALFLVNSELLVISSNAAGIVVSLCVVAVCCFLRNRFVAVGMLCLAISLTIKPQETGLVWLFFLLAGGVYRKRALQTLLVTVAISLPALLWVWHFSPHWLQEWHSNLAVFSARGGINDPGPASAGGHGLAMVISLQSILSVFRDDPHFYNLGSYVLTAPLLLVWAVVTLRNRTSPTRTWLALAAIAAISMLPVYHRQYDAKLLLLTVPACVMLWAEGSVLGKLALLVNTAAFVLTGDLTWAILLGLIGHLHLAATGFSGWLSTALQVFPAPLMLLAMAIFYLWVYARRRSGTAPETEFRS
ncbi:MAG: glycosyltransferase 87 family protein [Terracidiphilus sp.]